MQFLYLRLSAKLALALAACTPLYCSAELPSNRQAVLTHVRVRCGSGVGSGVIVHTTRTSSRILTARHVIRSGGRIAIDDGNGYWTGASVRVVAESGNQDLALLEVDRPSRYTAKIAPRGHRISRVLVAVGGPTGKPPVVHRVSQGRTRYAGKRFAVSKSLTFGRSGGAAFDESGYLVGIQSFTDFSGGHTGFEDLTKSGGWVDRLRRGLDCSGNR